MSPLVRLANGKRIDSLKGDALRRLQGKEIGMVFQDPLTSLNPLLRIGDQLVETMLTHLPIANQRPRNAPSPRWRKSRGCQTCEQLPARVFPAARLSSRWRFVPSRPW